ncbi:MAG: GTP-binding protein [Chromatiales bacterium]|nr:GTP-binding protein [Gammaproteobacteria bacterium]MCP5352559.1 GTP-binding protein [Chromatiales bacterium]
MLQPVRRVPTNLILGSLGVGKTTVIRTLLAHAPDGERWAVLVNEFGEIGIDAALIGNDDRVREVAGGCMCCAAGVSTQVAVAQILRDVRPDRLLIEASGLGHPGGIIDLLRTPPLAAGIELRAVIGLLDPREYTPERWRDSALYREQITLPDLLLLTKTDLAAEADIARLRTFIDGLYPPKRVERGAFSAAWLDQSTALPPMRQARSVFARMETGIDAPPQPTTEPAFGRHEQLLDGVAACGWLWPADAGFSRPRLTRLLSGLGTAELTTIRRAKGVLRTGREWQLFNATRDGVSVDDIAWRRDSRIELIAEAGATPDWDAIERALQSCMV